MEQWRKYEKHIGVRIKGLEQLFIVQNLEFFLVGFDSHFSVRVLSPDDAADVWFVIIERLDVCAGLKGCVHDSGFWADHVD